MLVSSLKNQLIFETSSFKHRKEIFYNRAHLSGESCAPQRAGSRRRRSETLRQKDWQVRRWHGGVPALERGGA
jgi:hypothetical protein